MDGTRHGLPSDSRTQAIRRGVAARPTPFTPLRKGASITHPDWHPIRSSRYGHEFSDERPTPSTSKRRVGGARRVPITRSGAHLRAQRQLWAQVGPPTSRVIRPAIDGRDLVEGSVRHTVSEEKRCQGFGLTCSAPCACGCRACCVRVRVTQHTHRDAPRGPRFQAGMSQPTSPIADQHHDRVRQAFRTVTPASFTSSADRAERMTTTSPTARSTAPTARPIVVPDAIAATAADPKTTSHMSVSATTTTGTRNTRRVSDRDESFAVALTGACCPLRAAAARPIRSTERRPHRADLSAASQRL